MRPILFILALSFALHLNANAQTTCIYLTDNTTYKNEKTGETLTFVGNNILINGKVASNLSYDHTDCTIDIFDKGKKINTLEYGPTSTRKEYRDRDGLFDLKNVFYAHVIDKKKSAVSNEDQLSALKKQLENNIADLDVANDQMKRIKEFHVGRSTSEREGQIKKQDLKIMAIRDKIQNITDEINKLQKKR